MRSFRDFATCTRLRQDLGQHDTCIRNLDRVACLQSRKNHLYCLEPWAHLHNRDVIVVSKENPRKLLSRSPLHDEIPSHEPQTYRSLPGEPGEAMFSLLSPHKSEDITRNSYGSNTIAAVGLDTVPGRGSSDVLDEEGPAPLQWKVVTWKSLTRWKGTLHNNKNHSSPLESVRRDPQLIQR